MDYGLWMEFNTSYLVQHPFDSLLSRKKELHQKPVFKQQDHIKIRPEKHPSGQNSPRARGV